ncbi:MAG: AsmA family protein [Vampirovibrionales bacterium]
MLCTLYDGMRGHKKTVFQLGKVVFLVLCVCQLGAIGFTWSVNTWLASMPYDVRHPVHPWYVQGISGLRQFLGLQSLTVRTVPTLHWDMWRWAWYLRVQGVSLRTPYGSHGTLQRAEARVTQTDMFTALLHGFYRASFHGGASLSVMPRVEQCKLTGLSGVWYQADTWRVPKPKAPLQAPSAIHDTAFYLSNTVLDVLPTRRETHGHDGKRTLRLGYLGVEHLLSETIPLQLRLSHMDVRLTRPSSDKMVSRLFKGLQRLETYGFAGRTLAGLALEQATLQTRFPMGWRWDASVFQPVAQLEKGTLNNLRPVFQSSGVREAMRSQGGLSLTWHAHALPAEAPHARVQNARTQLSLTLTGMAPQKGTLHLDGQWQHLPSTWQGLRATMAQDTSSWWHPSQARVALYRPDAQSTMVHPPSNAALRTYLKYFPVSSMAPLLQLAWKAELAQQHSAHQTLSRYPSGKLSLQLQPTELRELLRTLPFTMPQVPLQATGILALHCPDILPLIAVLQGATKPSSRLRESIIHSGVYANHVALRLGETSWGGVHGTLIPQSRTLHQLTGHGLGMLPWQLEYEAAALKHTPLALRGKLLATPAQPIRLAHGVATLRQHLVELQRWLPAGLPMKDKLGQGIVRLSAWEHTYHPQGQLTQLEAYMPLVQVSQAAQTLPQYRFALEGVRATLPFPQWHHLTPELSLKGMWDTRTLALQTLQLREATSARTPWLEAQATLPLSWHASVAVGVHAQPFSVQVKVLPDALQSMLLHLNSSERTRVTSSSSFHLLAALHVDTPTFVQADGQCDSRATLLLPQSLSHCDIKGQGVLSGVRHQGLSVAPSTLRFNQHHIQWETPIAVYAPSQASRLKGSKEVPPPINASHMVWSGMLNFPQKTWSLEGTLARVPLQPLLPLIPPKSTFRLSALQGQVSGRMKLQGSFENPSRTWDWQGKLVSERLTLGLHLPMLQGQDPPEHLFRVPYSTVTLLPQHRYVFRTEAPAKKKTPFQASYGEFPLAYATLHGVLPSLKNTVPQLDIALQSVPASPVVALPALQDWLPHTHEGEAPWLKKVWHSEGLLSLKADIHLGKTLHHRYQLSLQDAGLSAPDLLGTPLPLSHLQGTLELLLASQASLAPQAPARLSQFSISTPTPLTGYWGDSPGTLHIEKSRFSTQAQTLMLHTRWEHHWEPGTLNTLLQQGLNDVTARALPLRGYTKAHLQAHLAFKELQASSKLASRATASSSWVELQGEAHPAPSLSPSDEAATEVPVVPKDTLGKEPLTLPEAPIRFSMRMTPEKLTLHEFTVQTLKGFFIQSTPFPLSEGAAPALVPTQRPVTSSPQVAPCEMKDVSASASCPATADLPLLQGKGWWQLPTDPTWQRAYQVYLQEKHLFEQRALQSLRTGGTMSQPLQDTSPPLPPPLQNQWAFHLDPHAPLETMTPPELGLKGRIALHVGHDNEPSATDSPHVGSQSVPVAKPFFELTADHLVVPWLNIAQLNATIYSKSQSFQGAKTYLAPLIIDISSFQSPGIDVSLEATLPLQEWLSRPTGWFPVPLQDVRIKRSKQLDIASLQDLIASFQAKVLRAVIAPQTQSLISTAWQQPAGLGVTFEQAPFSFNEVLLNTMILKDVQGQIAIRPSGLIELKPLQFKLAGGTVESRLWMNPLEQNLTSLEMVANQVKANPLMMVLVGTPNKVFGTMDAKLQVVTQGANVQSMLQNANGQAIFNLQEGRIPDIDGIEKLLTTANLLRGGVLGWNLNSFAKVFLSNKRFQARQGSIVSGSFQIAQGVAYTHDLMTTSENLGLLFDGGMRLDNGLSSFRLTGQSMVDTYGLFGGVGRWSLSKAIRSIPILGYLPGGKPGVLKLIPGLTYVPGFGGPVSDRARFSADIEGTLDHVVNFRWLALPQETPSRQKSLRRE